MHRRVVVCLMGLLAGCDGPGPLTPEEVRWRWRHGTLVEATAFPDGVAVVVACPPPTEGVTARFRLASREVRIWERGDPLGRRDPLRFLASRRCEDAFVAAHGRDPPR